MGKKNFVYIIIASIILIFFAILGILNYIQTKNNLTELVLSRRLSISHLASKILEERFERLIAVGVSSVNSKTFLDYFDDGNWKDAISEVEKNVEEFDYIGRIYLVDSFGKETASFPESLTSIGKDFTYRDWYQGAMKDKRPYVSKIYKATFEPHFNVFAVAVPVKGVDQEILGILVMRVNIDPFFKWVKDIEIGEDGFIFVTDQAGVISYHPKFPPDGDMIDFSSVPAIQKGLTGERGIDVLFNPIEQINRLSTYEKVLNSGWAVAITQPVQIAFAARSVQLRQIVVVYSAALLLFLFIFYLLFRIRKKEEEIFNLKDEFVAITSHELRSPICVVNIEMDLLLSGRYGEINKKQKEKLLTAKDHLQRLNLIINDLLDIAKIEAGKMEMQKELVDIGELIKEIIKTFMTEAGQKSLDLRMFLPEKKININIDPGKIRQVFYNLVKNSIKFTDAGYIEVGVKEFDEEIQCYVSDTGVGISKEELPLAFNKFQQLKSKTKNKTKGTGLGLAISKAIITSHGGKIWIESEQGKGAKFIFSLPKITKIN